MCTVSGQIIQLAKRIWIQILLLVLSPFLSFREIYPMIVSRLNNGFETRSVWVWNSKILSMNSPPPIPIGKKRCFYHQQYQVALPLKPNLLIEGGEKRQLSLFGCITTNVSSSFSISRVITLMWIQMRYRWLLIWDVSVKLEFQHPF